MTSWAVASRADGKPVVGRCGKTGTTMLMMVLALSCVLLMMWRRSWRAVVQ